MGTEVAFQNEDSSFKGLLEVVIHDGFVKHQFLQLPPIQMAKVHKDGEALRGANMFRAVLLARVQVR